MAHKVLYGTSVIRYSVSRSKRNWYYDRAVEKFEECLNTSLGRFKSFSLERPQLVIKK